MERTTLDLWVGVFVAAGLAAVMVLALKVGNMSSVNLGDSIELQAEFDNIGGLKVRAPVKSAGVVVGRVTEIRFDNQKFEAVVVMKVDRRYQFPKDTSASIMTSGLLGEQYVGLEAGAEAMKLTDGDSIKLTQSAVVLENRIGQFLYSKAADGSTTDKSGAK